MPCSAPRGPWQLDVGWYHLAKPPPMSLTHYLSSVQAGPWQPQPLAVWKRAVLERGPRSNNSGKRTS